MWIANTALALTAGSAIAAAYPLALIIGGVVAAPFWLLTHAAALIPNVPLIPLSHVMAVVVGLMFLAVVCDVIDGTVDRLAVWFLVLLGSVGTWAAGYPGEWTEWITAHVNAITIGPVSSFFGG